MSNQLIEKIKEECLRIEEDALYSSKSHYNASCSGLLNLAT